MQLSSFEQYLHYIKENTREKEVLINLITTNVTSFFREKHHFTYLTETYLPFLEQKVQKEGLPKKVRIWSSASSTGEEPYSIAITLLEYFRHKRDWKMEILASDINTEVLKKANKGIYKKEEVSGVPYPLLKKYFLLGKGKNEGLLKVKDEVKKIITFRRMNLAMDEPFPIKEPLNVIFCRNVFIYFKRDTQEKIIRRFYDLLQDDGLLILGHSESISQQQKILGTWKLVHQTVYQKK